MTETSELYEVEGKEGIQERVLAYQDGVLAASPDGESSGVRFVREADNYGFASISHYILEDKTLSDAAKVTYGVLLKWAMQRGVAWPSIKAIAARRGKSEAQIGEHLKELVKRGLIERKKQTRPDGGNGVTITYILDVEVVYRPTTLENQGSRHEKPPSKNKYKNKKSNTNTKNTLIIATPEKSSGVAQPNNFSSDTSSGVLASSSEAIVVPICGTMTIEKGKPTSQPETIVAPARAEDGAASEQPPAPETAFTILADAYTPPGKKRKFIALTASQKNYIESYVVPSRFELWRSTCEAWALSGFRPTNIRGLVEWFVNGVPHSRKNGGYGQGSNSSPLRAARGVDD